MVDEKLQNLSHVEESFFNKEDQEKILSSSTIIKFSDVCLPINRTSVNCTKSAFL